MVSLPGCIKTGAVEVHIQARFLTVKKRKTSGREVLFRLLFFPFLVLLFDFVIFVKNY